MEVHFAKPHTCFKDFKKNLGSYYNNTSRLFNPESDITVKDINGAILFILKKNAISESCITNTVKHYLPIMKKMKSTNRGFASGSKEREIHTNFERSNPVHSTVTGYIDSPNNKLPCRLSQFSKIHFEEYKKGIPMINAVNDLFKATIPERYEHQYNKASKTEFRIEETAFTTVTINYNFQTALHVDKGDCKEGFGVLVVSGDENCGGYLLFPRYDIGVLVKTGDVLFMNVHEYHCNSEVRGERMSFVFYLRNRLLDCSHNKLLEDLGVADGKYWDTSLLIKRILEKIGYTGTYTNFKGEWEVDNENYRVFCKNRQYKLHDKKINIHITNLYTIWSYLLKKYMI